LKLGSSFWHETGLPEGEMRTPEFRRREKK